MFSRTPQSCARLVIRSNQFGPQKSKSSTSTPKKQLADMLTKGNFTRDEWNHLLCLFNVSHFSSTVCSEAMAKRVQQDSGEERVTAKSRPMMSLIARVPSTLSSSASESPGKKSYGNQSPWSANAEKDDRTEQPPLCMLKEKQGHSNSSSGSDETESELSVGIQKRVKKWKKKDEWSSAEKTKTIFDECYRKLWKTFCDMVNVHVCNIGISTVFMGKNYLDNCHSITNTKELTLKQVFDISARLVSEQDEISGVETIGWETHSWKYLSLIGDEKVISLLNTQRSTSFSDSVLCLGKTTRESLNQTVAWEDRLKMVQKFTGIQNLG